MVKPILPEGSQSAGDVGSSSLPSAIKVSDHSQTGIAYGPLTRLPHLSGGGRPGSGSVLSEQQRSEAYQSIQADVERGTQALSQYRATKNPELLTRAREYLLRAQMTYQENFSSSEGTLNIHNGKICDVGGLNTRLNAASLALRRAEHLVV